ncbi:Crp/Fnr family transcriptional regulator [bacterium]|nr:Crp/Fnr family transcriptional regulator [bacterium]
MEGDDLRMLDEIKICNIYKPGQVVFYQGNPCLGLYCIESGTIAIRKQDAEGESALVRLCHDGQTLGYRTFFAGGTYSASAEALTEARICFIDKAGVNRILEHNPAVGLAFLQHIARDLGESEELRLQAVTLPVRTRLANLLLALKDVFSTVDDDGNIVIELPMSRQDIADMVGARPETIARTIRSLQDDGVATFKGREVMVRDLDALLDELEPTMGDA